MTEQFWWKRVCVKDVRRQVILRATPSLEGQTVWDGPWSMDECAIHREAGIAGVLVFQSTLAEHGPPTAVESPPPTTETKPVAASRRRAKAPEDVDESFLRALSEV
jgi:hypothetical protein